MRLPSLSGGYAWTCYQLSDPGSAGFLGECRLEVGPSVPDMGWIENWKVEDTGFAAMRMTATSMWAVKRRPTGCSSKSGIGRTWERKFLGFRITRQGQIEVSPESLVRLKQRVRWLWRSCQSLSSRELRDQWKRFIRGWWNYYGLAEWRRPVFGLEGWIRRHIRKCFWLRWHDRKGRRKALRGLGLRGRQLKVVHSSRGAWRIAASPSLHTALRNARLRSYGFLMPSDLAGS